MYGFFRFVAFLLAVGLLAVVGISIYNAGVSAGIAADAGVLPPFVGQPWGTGWDGGFFGFVFGLFFLFLFFGLIFGLFRAAFGWGHGGRHHGWRGHHGYRGYGHGYRGYGPADMPDQEKGPDQRREPRDAFEAWHRELHDEESGTPDTPVGSAKPEPPATST
jgi:hypothetical protein